VGVLYQEGRAAAVTVGTTAVELDAGLGNITGLIVHNNSSNTVYLGFNDAVTTSTGFPLIADEKFYLDGHARVWAIAAQAGNDVRVMEVA
jgi:hypothetical protein